MAKVSSLISALSRPARPIPEPALPDRAFPVRTLLNEDFEGSADFPGRGLTEDFESLRMLTKMGLKMKRMKRMKRTLNVPTQLYSTQISLSRPFPNPPVEQKICLSQLY